MRTITLVLAMTAALLLGSTIGVVLAKPMTETTTVTLPDLLLKQFDRPCIMAPGGSTEVDCSAGAATSGALNQWTRYLVQCTAGAHIAWGSTASMTAADAGDIYLPTGEIFIQTTTPDSDYLSCDSSVGIAGAGKCYYQECR